MTLWDATSARHYHWEVEFVKLTNRLKGIISNARYVLMKEINIKENQQAVKAAQKEICVHKLLKHHNIVQCYGSRIEAGAQFIFLEYLSGGELFDRIGKLFGLRLCTYVLDI